MSIHDQAPIVKLEKKVAKKFSEALVSEMRGLTQSQLEDEVFRLSKNVEEVVKAKEDDEKLKQLQSEINEARGVYDDAKRGLNLKIKFLLALYLDKYGTDLK
jgi:chaperonin cofactor prefoldin